jgi:hypothetical protein
LQAVTVVILQTDRVIRASDACREDGAPITEAAQTPDG